MPNSIKFEATDTEMVFINQCVARAEKELSARGLSTLMDLCAVNTTIQLDFEKLLNFPEFDFAHDIRGIANHINRKTGLLEDFFIPRCAKQKAV